MSIPLTDETLLEIEDHLASHSIDPYGSESVPTFADCDCPDYASALLSEVRRQRAELAEQKEIIIHLSVGHRSCHSGCDWHPRVEKARRG